MKNLTIGLLLLIAAPLLRAEARLDFSDLEPIYYVGDELVIELTENLQTNRFDRVDLWVAVQLPNGSLLFMTPLPFARFTINQQPYRESLDTTEKVHRVLEFEVIPGLGGDYLFYAVYVQEGTNPLADNFFLVSRSNLAKTQTTISNILSKPSTTTPVEPPPPPTTTPVEPTPTPPANPVNLTANAGDSQVVLSWQPVAGAVAYKLHFEQAGGGKGTLPVVGTTSFQHTGLHNGVNYTYWVTAINAADLESEYSNAVVATPAAPVFPPAAPVNLAANPDNGQIILTWQPVSDADAYLVYWEAAGGSGHSISTRTPSYVHTGLTNGTTYYYRVVAVNSTTRLESASSPVISASPCCDAPPPPTTVAGEIFRDTLADGSLGPEMVWIPAGSFRMGDLQGGGGSDEQPVHEVSVGQFAIGRYEVTFAEYDKFAEVTGRTKPSDSGWGRGNRPVIYVSWDDATAYAEWLSQQTKRQYRLPTEAEWEYSARAGTETKYWWGNDIGSNKANCWNCGDSFEYTAPVGSFGANPWGLYDTAGNVWEWTCSEYESSYSGKEQVCSTNEDGLFAVRGGSWVTGTGRVRSANRNWWSRTFRYGLGGVRLARIP
jgi:formylglycine-generating enzyme required for sulfatase activity